MSNDHIPPAESPGSHQAEGARDVSGRPLKGRDRTSSARRRRWRDRLARERWRGCVRQADPVQDGGECAWGVADPAACRACRRGTPCRFERSLWGSVRDAGRQAGWSESAAVLRANCELRVSRLAVSGADELEILDAERKLLGLQLEQDSRERRLALSKEKLELARAALEPPPPYKERLSRILDLPASPPAGRASGALEALPAGAVPEPLDVLPAEPVAEPAPVAVTVEPPPPGAVALPPEPAPPAPRWPSGLPSLDRDFDI